MTSVDLRVSAIIPVYNGERFLAEAVASVRRQARAPLEIIVVDDGSTDGSADVAARLGDDVRCLHQPHAGPAAARNRGLAAARGDVIAFLDADDLWSDDKLTRQLPVLAHDRHVDIVVGCTQPVRRSGSGAGDGPSRLIACAPVWVALSLGAASIRRGVFDAVGNFDTALTCGEDVDWFLRAREAGVNVQFTEAVNQLYRFHDTNLTRDEAARDRGLLRALKRSLDRRRRSAASRAAEPLPELPDIAAAGRYWRADRDRAPDAGREDEPAS